MSALDLSAMFDRSALVVAHPDDEALWFSSILERVDKLLICFMDMPSRPDWSEGRRRCVASYPLRNVAFLGLQESAAFNSANWLAPEPTTFGLKVSRRRGTLPGFSDERYRANYSDLKTQLSDRLRTCRNVFTHNPWGDYGHEEHVQVFRAIREVQRIAGFKVWFSNYCSNKSYNLMLEHISGFEGSYVTMACNDELGKSLMRLYKQNNCWTWFDEYNWFSEECFMSAETEMRTGPDYGRIFPLNFIKLDLEKEKQPKKTDRWTDVTRKIARRMQNGL